METLDVPPLAHPGHADAIYFEVSFVYFLHRFVAQFFLGRPNSPGGFDPGDSGVEMRAGEPEPGGHVAGWLVLDNARNPERATGDNTKRLELAP